jgi:bifunctional pyridoxal-dependent enzyme with beta-cystathionase and maltose regulon repressor activities
MESDKKYNGWNNYETWLVALWIDNEEWSYNYAREITQNVKRENPNVDDIITHASILSDELKNWIEEINPLKDNATLFADLLNAAISEVDWYEISEHYLQES